ncbi:hypothetical protein PsorP6_017118 [Peronosclerospora sorghi]|uniref:Uncharacterized protein n=1 Tax=Peronosclerospora sorghi TaxID=230839 RepID=A0ACC0WFX2_9STRA|nr:hypothetical protein PsorP6_017118 [Peronosclerospora sorghi]
MEDADLIDEKAGNRMETSPSRRGRNTLNFTVLRISSEATVVGLFVRPDALCVPTGINRYEKRDNREKKVALHVIGARAESLMPRYLWDELSCFYPRRQFDIKLIGDHVPIIAKAQYDGHGHEIGQIV